MAGAVKRAATRRPTHYKVITGQYPHHAMSWDHPRVTYISKPILQDQHVSEVVESHDGVYVHDNHH